MAALRFIIWLAVTALLRLRYRVKVVGLEQVKGLKHLLVLPNHPAYSDPPLVLSNIVPALQARPMLLARMFHNPLLFWIPRALGAIEVPDLTKPSAEARAQAQGAIDELVDGLQQGGNFVLWPSGLIQRDGVERLGAARTLTEVLARAPQANIVALRTTGLWGSSFSYAYSGEAPNLVRRLLRCAALFVGNLIFLMPKRQITITLERIDRSRLPELERHKVNAFFEDWYNADGPAEPKFVPYHFLQGQRAHEFPARQVHATDEAESVSPQVRAAVVHIVAEKIGRALDSDERVATCSLDSMGLDSLDAMDVALAVERRFSVSAPEAPRTLGDLWLLAAGLLAGAPTKPPAPAWFNPPAGDSTASILGDTIPEAFVRRALHNPRDTAAADDLSGMLTYERCLIGATLMAEQFADIEADRVGLMLPASVATDLAFMGLHLAGKLPVVLNWTTGPANVKHAADAMGLTHVVTSKAFLDRSGVTIDGPTPIYMEELRRRIGRLVKLRALLRVKLNPGRLTARATGADPDAPAVVLFTSGSEKAPKAVPLSHRNLLSNLRSVLEGYHVKRRDAVLGFLPAFHSFGLTMTTLLPLLMGGRVVHHPDPTDAGALARKTAAYKPTILCGTPSFISRILDRAEREDLASVRMVVVGAERCPMALYERLRELAPNAKLLEGYGVTECSPLVACNLEDDVRPGTIGKPLPSVEVRIVDPDTHEPRPTDQTGMMIVHGPNVFGGYLGDDVPNPFHEREGKQWYVTGDLVRQDASGYLHFEGRLKRFLKAGGEMISLPALEEPFTQRHPPTDDGPRVAVEGVETDGDRRIVLFTTVPIELRQANALLAEHGYHGVMRIDEVRQVDHIPVLGTGKTDYKVLRQRVLAPADEGDGFTSSEANDAADNHTPSESDRTTRQTV